MKRAIAWGLLATIWFSPATVKAANHAISEETVQARLAEPALQRLSDVAALGRLLDRSEALSVVSKLGTNVEAVRAAIPTLSDSELRDLATRAAALQTDPVSGAALSRDVETILIVFLIVALVILVLKAV